MSSTPRIQTAPAASTSTRLHRAVGLAALVVGIALIAVTLALSLFPRAYAGERIAQSFGPAMSDRGVQQMQAGLDVVGGMVGGLDEASDDFARDLGMSRAEFDRFVAASYPAVAAGAEQVPGPAAEVFGPVVADARALRDEWHSVSHIPGLGLPAPAAPWLIVLVGAALALTGAATLVRPHRAGTAAVAVIGLGMVVGPLALSMPQKTSDIEPILEVGRVALSPEAADVARDTGLAVDEMVREMKANMLPGLARRAGISRAELDRTIERDHPGLATGLREWPALAPASYDLVARQAASVEDFAEIDEIGYSGLLWVALGPGIALLLIAGAALTVSRTRRDTA